MLDQNSLKTFITIARTDFGDGISSFSLHVPFMNNLVFFPFQSPFESKGIVAVACVANFVKKTLSLLGVDYEPTQVCFQIILSSSVRIFFFSFGP